MEHMKGSKSYTDLIKEIAGMAGYSVEKKDDSTTSVTFNPDGKRHQIVLISFVGKDLHGNSILSITSTALTLSKGEKLSEKRADYLLRENARLAHGAWAIREEEKDDQLVMTDTQIVETLELEELVASILSVASLSDAMENKMTGEDSF